jgi:hypothetical protein
MRWIYYAEYLCYDNELLYLFQFPAVVVNLICGNLTAYDWNVTSAKYYSQYVAM